jgi:hypothetical protein
LPGRPDDSARAPWASGLVALAFAATGLSCAGLAITNPSPSDFQAFAAERLVDVISEELCGDGGLPVLMRMAITNCQELVQAQRLALAQVVADHTHRSNFGLLSLYRSEVGGQTLLRWRVPRFRSSVLAVAGQFVLMRASADNPQREP